MPPSDTDSLVRNAYDGFYKTRPRSFWGENEIIKLDNRPAKACNHTFKYTTGGIICTKCNFGLLGSGLSIKDEKAYAQGEPIRFTP